MPDLRAANGCGNLPANMKPFTRTSRVWMAGIAFATAFMVQAYAETPREELAHAYTLLKFANQNYEGHRGNAMNEISRAAKSLKLKLKGDAWEHERQRKSDEQVADAGKLVRDARDKLEAQDRERVVKHLDKAIEEIEAALRVK